MRVEGTKVTLTIPIPVGKPDLNGCIYTKEAVENAMNNFRTNLPIIYKENAETNEMVIGTTSGTSHIVTWDSENQVCKLSVDGVIFYSGAEIIVNDITKEGEITDFRIASIGLTI